MKRKKIIDEICLFLEKENDMNNGYFCIYGSYATDSQNDLSDIDILYISKSIEEPTRIGTLYNKIKVTIYKVSENHLLQVSRGKYGGYFCGKMFNPHIAFPDNEKNTNFIDSCVAIFFSNILKESLCKLNRVYSEDEILKSMINLYMELYPEYFAYVMRLMKIDDFNSIWDLWKKRIVSSLLIKNVIKQINDKFCFNKNVTSAKFDKLKINYISRFWVFGSVSHNSNLNFYDFYVSKNTNYIIENNFLRKRCEKFLGINYTLLDEDLS